MICFILFSLWRSWKTSIPAWWLMTFYLHSSSSSDWTTLRCLYLLVMPSLIPMISLMLSVTISCFLHHVFFFLYIQPKHLNTRMWYFLIFWVLSNGWFYVIISWLPPYVSNKNLGFQKRNTGCGGSWSYIACFYTVSINLQYKFAQKILY